MSTGYKINYLQTDQNGTLLQERSYDAWGRLRHPDDWSAEYYEPENLLKYTYRSYTGHSLSRTCFGNPMTATFHSPDPYVQMPTNTLNYNRYSYVLNNPLKYTDPSGEIIFTALAAIFAPPLLPIAIGADIGWITGGIRGAKSDVGFIGGAWRGAVVGAVGGALAMTGGGTFAANLAWGAGQGAITGGLDAALWGNDIGKGMLYGAASGMAFATVSSGIEAYRNYKGNYGFKTNQGVLNEYWKNEDYQGYIDFVQNRYGFSELDITYKEDFDAYGKTFDNGTIEVGNLAANSQSEMKATLAHEAGHRYLDWTPTNPYGKRKSYNFSHVENPISRKNLRAVGGDGAAGMFSEIRNSGKLHINRRTLNGTRFEYFVPGYGNANVYNNSLWHVMSKSERFYYWIPRRFSGNLIFVNY